MPPETEVKQLDKAIDEVSDPAESQCELLREHLESARNYLLGDMPFEYLFSLRLANEALNCVSSAERRTRLEGTISGLLSAGH